MPEIFFEIAAVLRDFEKNLQAAREECDDALRKLGKDAPEPRKTEVVDRLLQKSDSLLARTQSELVRINGKHADIKYNPLAYSYLDGPDGKKGDDVMTFVRWLHWMRHDESLNANARRDAGGDLSAWNHFHRTGMDFRKLLHRKGPIKPFKSDPIHRELLELLLCFEAETDPLTAEERAACFDEFCACGKSHDADALKKQYARLKRDLSA